MVEYILSGVLVSLLFKDLVLNKAAYYFISSTPD